MLITTNPGAIEPTGVARSARPATSAAMATAYSALQIMRRFGAVVSFEPSKFALALMKAFLDVHGKQGAA